MRKLPPSEKRGRRWSATRRFNGWLATWLQDRRRERWLPTPVLVATWPSLATWQWDYANPARWNAYNSLDGGLTYQFDDWVVGSARQYAPDGGDHLMFIVGVDANGVEVTRPSNAVRPDEAISSTTLLTDLVGYWKLDEASGMTRADSHSSGFDLSEYGAVAVDQVAGQLNDAAGFRRDIYENDRRLTAASHPALQVPGDFAVSFWAQLNGPSDTSEHLLGIDSSFVLHLGNGAYRSLGLALWGYGFYPICNLQGPTELFDWIWYHLALVRSGSVVSLYVDGVLDATGPTEAIPVQTGGDFNIGGSQWGCTAFGDLDEVGFWNRALSGAEVAQLYNSGNGLGYEMF